MKGRVAVVTGAAGLLGQRHCRALAQAGAYVVVTDLDGDRCAEVAGRVTAESGVEAMAYVLDVTDAASVCRLRDRVLERFDRLDALVNNAGVDEKVGGPGGASVDFEDYPLAAWEHSLRVNVTGVFLCCQALGGEMARRGAGSIVNVASTYGLVAPDQRLYRDERGTALVKSAAYPTGKAAVLGLTRYLAAYWGHRGVRVNALSPGGVRNGQDGAFVARYAERTPLGRMADPWEYEGALVFLAGDASSYMTGANLVVDGGWTTW